MIQNIHPYCYIIILISKQKNWQSRFLPGCHNRSKSSWSDPFTCPHNASIDTILCNHCCGTGAAAAEAENLTPVPAISIILPDSSLQLSFQKDVLISVFCAHKHSFSGRQSVVSSKPWKGFRLGSWIQPTINWRRWLQLPSRRSRYLFP